MEELLKDFLSYARQHELLVWQRERSLREIREIGQIWKILKNTPTLPNNPHFPTLPNSPEITVNLMITLVHQANYLIDKLVVSLKKKHTEEGGFTENLLKKRLEYRRHNS